MNATTDLWNVHPRHRWLHGERPSQPVEFDDETGMWHIYGYPEAVSVLGDPATYSSDVARRFVPGADQWDFDGNLTQLDPPEHKKLRTLVSRAFTPKMVADLESSIAKVTNGLIDELDTDEFDLVDAIAYPLPMIVIADLLGTPREDRDLIKQWADDSLAERGQIKTKDEDGEQARSIASQRDDQRKMDDYLLEHVTDRRKNPKEDLLTSLIQAEVDGDRLTDNQVVNFASLLFFAGHITTTMLLGNTLLCLDAYPDQMARVREDRALVPLAIEESLRYLSPLASAYRATNVDVELGGTRIPKDQMLEVWLAAANRDPRQFTDPDTFDISRTPNPHLGFSHGIHFCLGGPLARLEGRVALNILLERFAELRVDHDRAPEFLTSPDFTGVWTLPLRTRR
ncbi:cytochrome P450 [Streptomyces botrytidirepellens]|uniref:Cytochrome P450 n=1 Tax=Streptomyces botrytidirepellens TaxID=2486417 RepID=A0A3M8SFK1_9ACTN|nr:cytochrome P450 [Streptomyces botrytidirepellens]RNF77732.1 cytochrome P450 [Streptomyces botrytidirepellens]